MASSQGFFAAFPTSKRSACDRCRIQKLRCLPRDRNAEACSRCVRLNVKCTTTYPRPGGRPSNASLVASQPKASGPESSMTVFSATQGPPSPTNAGPAQAPRTTHPATTFDPTSLPNAEDSMDIFSFRPTLHDDYIFFDHSNNEETDDMQYHDLDDLSALQSLPVLTNGGSMDSGDATKNPRNAARDPTGTAKDLQSAVNKEERRQSDGYVSHERPSHVLGCDHRLFSLNLDLSRQLQLYLTVAPAQDSLPMDTSLDSPVATDKGQEEPLRSNLLGDALSDASEFLAIIQSYRTERRGSTGSDDNNHGSRPRLGFIAILNLLSVHLELVMIYEKLFRILNDRLSDTAVDLVDGLQGPLPRMQLTDFPIQRGNLQTKILIHAILHQFEMIETIMGLPAEFRVTEKQDDCSGLFEDRWARDLLEAMSNGKSCNAVVDKHCGLEALSSLRELLRRVQISLRM